MPRPSGRDGHQGGQGGHVDLEERRGQPVDHDAGGLALQAVELFGVQRLQADALVAGLRFRFLARLLRRAPGGDAD